MDVRITCPHCGFSKEFPEEKLPKGGSRVLCPKCRKPFTLPAWEGVEAASPPIRITCPHCGFFRDVAKSALPASRVKINCPGCKEVFYYPPPPPERGETGPEEPAVTPPPRPEAPAPPPPRPRAAPSAPAGSGAIGSLFSRAWGKYKNRFWPLIGLYLLNIVFFAVPAGVFGGLAFLAVSFGGKSGLAGAAALAAAGVVATVYCMSWAMAALFVALSDDGLGVGAALSEGKPRAWGFFWISLLIGVLVFGGYLFLVIPGILLTVWLFAAPFVLAAEEERGMDALLKSREYVRGHGWGTFGRLLLIWLVATLVGMVPVVGPVLSILAAPFTLAYVYFVYSDLKEAKETEFVPTRAEKVRLALTGLMGYIFVPLAAAAFLFSFSAKHGVPVGDMLRELVERAGPCSLGGVKFQQPGEVYPGNVPALASLSITGGPSIGEDTAVSSPQSVLYAPESGTMRVSLYVYAINYKGEVKLNGNTEFDIKGERDMNYNYSGSSEIKKGRNTFTVTYESLPEPWMREIKIEASSADGKKIATWIVKEPSGTKEFYLDIP